MNYLPVSELELPYTPYQVMHLNMGRNVHSTFLVYRRLYSSVCIYTYIWDVQQAVLDSNFDWVN